MYNSIQKINNKQNSIYYLNNISEGLFYDQFIHGTHCFYCILSILFTSFYVMDFVQIL